MPVNTSPTAAGARKLSREELFTWNRTAPAAVQKMEAPQPDPRPEPATEPAPGPSPSASTPPASAPPASPQAESPAPAAHPQPHAQTHPPAQPPAQPQWVLVGYGADGRPVYQPAGQPAAPVHQPPVYQPVYQPGPVPVASAPNYQPPQGAAAGPYAVPPGQAQPGVWPGAAPPAGPWITPTRLTVGALILSAAILVAALLRPATPAQEPDPGQPPIDETLKAKAEKIEVESDRRRELQKEVQELEGQLQRLRRQMGAFQPQASRATRPADRSTEAMLAWLRPTVTNLLSVELGRRPLLGASAACAAGLLAAPAPAEFGRVESSREAPSQSQAYDEELTRLRDENARLERRRHAIKSDLKEVRATLEKLRSLAEADLIVTQNDGGAVAVDRTDDGFVVRQKFYAGEAAEVREAIRGSGLPRFAGQTQLVRQLMSLDPGEAVAEADSREALNELLAPKAYVPSGVTNEQMVSFKPRTGRGEQGDTIGFVVGDRDANRLHVATIDGDRQYDLARDLVGPPIYDMGETLAASPRVNFFDYVALEVARELSQEPGGAHQTIAIKADIQLNTGYFRQLADTTAIENISWLTNAKQDELRTLAAQRDGLVETQIALTGVSQAVERDLKKRASKLDLNVVQRDERILREMLREQVIGGTARPSCTVADELEAMEAAARRGNLIYAQIDSDQSGRRVFMEKSEIERFNSLDRSAGGSGWRYREAGGSAGVGYGANNFVEGGAAGGGGGGGAGGFARKGRWGAGWGSGWGSGYLVGGASSGIAAELNAHAGAAAQDFYYHNGRIYQSERGFEGRESLTDDQRRDRYKAIVSAEQVAKRDRQLKITDYGRLDQATHLLKVLVSAGPSDGEITYEVSLNRTRDGSEIWNDSTDRPIVPPKLATTHFLAAGDLWVLNDGERAKRGRREQAPLLQQSVSPNRAGRLPETVVRTIPGTTAGPDTCRGLLSADPLSIDPESLLEGRRTYPIRLTKGFEGVPASQVMRCVVHRIVEEVAPKAGEVTDITPDGYAVVAMNNTQATWRKDQRLSALRSMGSLQSGFQRLPIDLIAVQLSDSGAKLHAERTAGGAGGVLRPGDRVIARDAVEPKVAIGQPHFYFPVPKKLAEFTQLGAGEHIPEEEHFDRDSLPDYDLIKQVYANPGWPEMQSRMERASEMVSGSVNSSLRKLNVASYDAKVASDKLPRDTTHYVHFYLKPLTTLRFELGVRVYGKRSASGAFTEGNAEELAYLTPEITLVELSDWEP